eukprot:TRINITY_DN55486_c0_g1_i2.p1 TRINITY_DN55486_c0_g1~~TRINITY_DN55486_c0_g1_i2.p1  ORF type:complete len:178 (-),score=13.67 TRINITY_DN55486_c0_g1_i2:95-628(-)
MTHAGLVYWLAQNPDCKLELRDLGAESVLKDLLAYIDVEGIHKQFLLHALKALSLDSLSREEILSSVSGAQSLDEILAHHPMVRFSDSPSSQMRQNHYSRGKPPSEDHHRGTTTTRVSTERLSRWVVGGEDHVLSSFITSTATSRKPERPPLPSSILDLNLSISSNASAAPTWRSVT